MRKLLEIASIVCLAACTPVAPPAPPPPAPPLTVEALIAAARKDQAAFEAIYASREGAARELAALNGKLQSTGYFRRVPARPAVESLNSQLRQLATIRLLVVKEAHVDLAEEPTPPSAAVIKPGERWQPRLDDLRLVIPLRLDVQGSARDVARYLDDLPTQVDRLLVVQRVERRPTPAGESPIVRLHLEAYCERALPQPELDLHWPGVDERIVAAGLDPSSPAVRDHPQLPVLVAQVELGQKRLPDVRRVLSITADFPRWQLRWQFAADRGAAIRAQNGAKLMGI
ncbi:MAG: hypothetical protein FJ100_17705 [Deltaproteobacteria bacterium]|nr:hypothetical protein [Deltaproteobacteria bacterium]